MMGCFQHKMVIKRTQEEIYQFQHGMFIEVMEIMEDMLNDPKIKVELKDPYIIRLDYAKIKLAKFLGIPNPPFKARDKDA